MDGPDIYSEMKSLDWVSLKCKITRSRTDLKFYLGPSDLKSVRMKYNRVDFMSKHQFEPLEYNEELPEFNSSQELIQQDINTSDQINMLPSGSWILRDRLAEQHQEIFDPGPQAISPAYADEITPTRQ